MNADKYEFKKFPIEKMPYDSIIVVIAKRNSGKSFFCRDLLSHFAEIPLGIVVSATEKKSPFFGTFMPPEFIFDEFDPAIVANLYERQEKLLTKHGKTSWKEKGGFDSRAFVLMDDCIADKRFMKDKGVRDIFFNGRHSNLMYIMTTQDCMALPPDLRGNIDYVFILRETRNNILLKIWNNYASAVPNFEMFKHLMGVFTENYGILVVDNKAQGNHITDQIFWYKAEDPFKNNPKFRICTGGKAWKFHDKFYNEEHLDPDKKKPEDGKTHFYDKKDKKAIKIVMAEPEEKK